MNTDEIKMKAWNNFVEILKGGNVFEVKDRFDEVIDQTLNTQTSELKKKVEKMRLSERVENDGSDEAWNRVAWQVNRVLDVILESLSSTEEREK